MQLLGLCHRGLQSYSSLKFHRNILVIPGLCLFSYGFSLLVKKRKKIPQKCMKRYGCSSAIYLCNYFFSLNYELKIRWSFYPFLPDCSMRHCSPFRIPLKAASWQQIMTVPSSLKVYIFIKGGDSIMHLCFVWASHRVIIFFNLLSLLSGS